MKSDLIVFGEDWGAHPSSTQHLIKRLLPERSVLWVNSIGLRAPKFCAADIKRIAHKARRMLTAKNAQAQYQTAIEQGPFVLQPPALPFPASHMARRINHHLIGAALRRQMEIKKLHRPILWASLPSAVDVLGAIDTQAVIYYCGDDFGALSGVDHTPVLEMEAELANRADVILAASPVLARKFPRAKTHLLPHGADIDLFMAGGPRPNDLPTGKPIAGFYGSLADWIDFDLLEQTARIREDWNFVLIGPMRSDAKAILALSNVFYLGEKPHAKLPAYVQHWDVSLLPFRDTAQIRASNPLKLREYLAVGRPIIGTPAPFWDGYCDLAHIVKTSQDFSMALDNCKNEGDILTQARQARVANESWDARSREVAALLDSF